MTLETTSQFRKDYKRAKKRGYNLELLKIKPWLAWKKLSYRGFVSCVSARPFMNSRTFPQFTVPSTRPGAPPQKGTCRKRARLRAPSFSVVPVMPAALDDFNGVIADTKYDAVAIVNPF